MREKYKKSFLFINIILFVCIIISLLNFFYFKIVNNVYFFLINLIPFLILYFDLGYEKKKRRFTYETMFYVFTYLIFFLIITYIIGLFSGFSQNVYILNMPNLLNNIIPYLLIIVSSELLRYQVVRKGDGSLLSYFLVIFLLIMVDITFFMNTYDISTYDGIIKFICSIVFPHAFKNVLLVYLARNGGPQPCILYRLIMDLKLFIVPIFPNFGLYIDSVVNTCIPVIVFGCVYFSLKQFKNEEVPEQKIKKTRLYNYFFIIILFMMIIVLTILTSCKYKYAMIAIGSNSMNPTIYKGDAVIYESNVDMSEYNIGDILVFKKDSKVVVHRIIDIKNIEGERIFYTKGDNNNGADGYPIIKTEVLGKCKKRIRFIGIFSVYLNELINS